MGYFTTTQLSPQHDLLLFSFSMLFSSNIATSNLSLYVFPPIRRRAS
jgi:hypothetical protein